MQSVCSLVVTKLLWRLPSGSPFVVLQLGNRSALERQLRSTIFFNCDLHAAALVDFEPIRIELDKSIHLFDREKSVLCLWY